MEPRGNGPRTQQQMRTPQNSNLPLPSPQGEAIFLGYWIPRVPRPRPLECSYIHFFPNKNIQPLPSFPLLTTPDKEGRRAKSAGGRSDYHEEGEEGVVTIISGYYERYPIPPLIPPGETIFIGFGSLAFRDRGHLNAEALICFVVSQLASLQTRRQGSIHQ
jgi:hypothetical protein